MPLRSLFVVLATILLAACNLIEQVDVVDDRIEAWHAVYNEGKAQELYAKTGEEYREVTSAEEMDELVAFVTERMGAVESTERTDTKISLDNGVTTTVIEMTTDFAKGEATETFTFRGTGEETRLVGWNIDSANFDDVATEEAPEEAVADPPVAQ